LDQNFILLIVNIYHYLERSKKKFIISGQLTSQASKKAGTTNLHIDVSDAVNVLVYVGIGGHGDDGIDKAEEIRRKQTSKNLKINYLL
jgi:hypothetical protein